MENVLERDRKLGDLEERADALQDGCAQFEKQVNLDKSTYEIGELPFFSLNKPVQKHRQPLLATQREERQREMIGLVT